MFIVIVFMCLIGILFYAINHWIIDKFLVNAYKLEKLHPLSKEDFKPLSKSFRGLYSDRDLSILKSYICHIYFGSDYMIVRIKNPNIAFKIPLAKLKIINANVELSLFSRLFLGLSKNKYDILKFDEFSVYLILPNTHSLKL